MPMTPHDFLVSLGTGEVAHASAESSFLGHRPGPPGARGGAASCIRSELSTQTV